MLTMLEQEIADEVEPTPGDRASTPQDRACAPLHPGGLGGQPTRVYHFCTWSVPVERLG